MSNKMDWMKNIHAINLKLNIMDLYFFINQLSDTNSPYQIVALAPYGGYINSIQCVQPIGYIAAKRHQNEPGEPNGV